MNKTKDPNHPPFTVKHAGSAGDVYFNVTKYEFPATRDYLEKLLRDLPVYFKMTKMNKDQTKPANNCRYEPVAYVDIRTLNIEVDINPGIFNIRIYPDKCDEVIVKIEILPEIINEKPEKTLVSLLNLIRPGDGQIVTSFYSQYENLKIHKPLSEKELNAFYYAKNFKAGINFEIHSYHPLYQKEFKLMEDFFYGPETLQKLLELIAGGEKNQLTAEKIHYWKKLIFYVVRTMRFAYEGPFGVAENDEIRLYYLDIWNKIENIQKDLMVLQNNHPVINEYLVECLEKLRYKISQRKK